MGVKFTNTGYSFKGVFKVGEAPPPDPTTIQFVAGYQSALYSSYNGIDWTQTHTITAGDIDGMSIKYYGSRWYAVTGTSYMYSDDGLSWTEVTNIPITNPEFTTSVAANPNNGTVLVSKINNSAGGGVIYRTTNNGGSWSTAATVANRYIYYYELAYISEEDKFVAALYDYVQDDGDIYGSNNNTGTSWSVDDEHRAGQSRDSGRCLFTKTATHKILGTDQSSANNAGQGGGIYRATIDGSETWTRSTTASVLEGTVGLCYDSGNDRVLRKTVGKSGTSRDKLTVSTDGGATFSDLRTNVADARKSQAGYNEIAYSPEMGRLIMLLGSGTVEYSDDGGDSWNSIDSSPAFAAALASKATI